MKPLPSLAALSTTFVLHLAAWAADGPPPGWEVTPPETKVVVKSIDRCGDNTDCHQRQTGLDAPLDTTPWQAFAVDVAKLPVLRKREAPKDGPPLKDAPAVRALDGEGRPFPWPDGAKREMRVMPPGKLGEVNWGDEWSQPFFEEPRYRGMGYGDTRSVDSEPGKPVPALDGPIDFISIDRGGAGLVYDHVVGKLEGTPQVAATLWEHAEAAPLPVGFGHAFREEGQSPSLVVLLPEVLLGMEGRRVAVRGGFEAGNRFSTAQPFTRYTMPAGIEATGTVMFSIVDTQRRRWLEAAEPKVKPPRLAVVLMASSRTSVEKAPVLVLFTRPRKSDF